MSNNAVVTRRSHIVYIIALTMREYGGRKTPDAFFSAKPFKTSIQSGGAVNKNIRARNPHFNAPYIRVYFIYLYRSVRKGEMKK